MILSVLYDIGFATGIILCICHSIYILFQTQIFGLLYVHQEQYIVFSKFTCIIDMVLVSQHLYIIVCNTDLLQMPVITQIRPTACIRYCLPKGKRVLYDTSIYERYVRKVAQ